MNFDHILEAPAPPQHHRPYTIREMIFLTLPHRSDQAVVLKGHQEATIIEIRLSELRQLIYALSPVIEKKGLKKGDTVLLASFACSNELANALLFAALTSYGIRVFIPIYPETKEFDYWLKETDFKAVILPYRETQLLKAHIREKETVHSIEQACIKNSIPLWDSHADFGVSYLLEEVKEGKEFEPSEDFFSRKIQLTDEAVIFSTSGSSGKSKLVVYTQKSFSLSCLSWQAAGLFEAEHCGNPCLTPLFTHTIGIRSWMNAIWSGHALCLLISEWFLTKPEIARYLLIRMEPGHIVGGPALYKLLLEFFRNYPELKTSLRKKLKTLISIGSSYQAATASQIRSALGLPLLNAFGSTETQMVLLNRHKNRTDKRREEMGTPLPGVAIGLKVTEEEDVYELYIKSPYASSRIIQETRMSGYLFTGDLVRYIDHEIFFYKRKGEDWMKDDFGVKIPADMLREYYPSLQKICRHIEWVPLENKPGMGALLFLEPDFNSMPIKEIAEWIKNRNKELKQVLEPFEFEHRHLERFSLELNEVPLTRKGTVSKHDILLRFEDRIKKIANPFLTDQKIEHIIQTEKSDLHQYSNPQLSQLLETLGLDIEFTRGEKDSLFYTNGQKEIAILDLVGGFGANLLGHQHPGIKQSLNDFINSGRPSLNTQGSQYHYPSLLAKELSKLFAQSTGKTFKTLFGNSGAEVVEMALHHAYFEWWTRLEKMREEQLQLYGSYDQLNMLALWDHNLANAAEIAPTIIVVNKCFHGNSSGARSLLNYKKQRNLFSGLLKPQPVHINEEDDHWKEKLLKTVDYHFCTLKIVTKENDELVIKEIRHSTIIASLVEPVRGEGGIKITDKKLLHFLSEQSFPLISDEIQCGLGRTGKFPAYGKADYYLLGKSLGGGYEKISALMIHDKNYKQDFAQYYNSTFANGEMAAMLALTTLKTINEDHLVEKSEEAGKYFKEKLWALAAKYPDIIESVEGEGMMLGIHFNHQIGRNNILLRNLLEHELFGYLIAGWLFHNKQIRVLPSLSKPDSLRIEPSAYFKETEIVSFCAALEEVCRIIRLEHLYELTRYLMNDDPYLDKSNRSASNGFPQLLEEAGVTSQRVGFVANFTAPVQELRMIEPDFNQASDTGLRILFDKVQLLLNGKPIRLFSKNLMDGRINFKFYLLPFDTAHLEAVNRWGKKRFYVAKIQEAIRTLSNQGCTHISLGAHCSIITGNGLYLASPKNTLIHTGNTLTVASALYHTRKQLESIKENNRTITIAITGANGNIGSTLALCLANELGKKQLLRLIGNSTKKLTQLVQTIRKEHTQVEWSTDFYSLRDADIIICCTNSNDPLVFPPHIHPEKKVFIIDIAVPGSVDVSVKKLNHVEFCKEASSVYLPQDPDLVISTHTAVGKIFCCAAEVILAGAYDIPVAMKGHLETKNITLLMKLAQKEGLFENQVYASSHL